MDDASAPAPVPIAVPKFPHTLKLTRAGLALLEGCMQELGPCETTDSVVLHSRIWQKVRNANNRILKLSYAPQGHDIEKAHFKGKDESDLSFQTKVAEYNEAFEAWKNEPVEIGLSDKHRDAARKAVEWVFNNSKPEGKSRVKMDPSIHAAQLLVALGLAKDQDAE